MSKSIWKLIEVQPSPSWGLFIVPFGIDSGFVGWIQTLGLEQAIMQLKRDLT